MNLLYFIRLLTKHLAILIILPFILVVLVFYLTKDQPKIYTSNTNIYTGITTGSSIVSLEESKVDLFATRTAFDNLINIINARSTVEEVGLQLLATHLMLDKPDPKIISAEKHSKLMELVPEKVKKLVVKGNYNKTLDNLREYMNSSYDNFIYELINHENPHYSSKKINSNIKVRRIQSSDIVEISYQSDDQGICKNTLEIITRVFIHAYTDIKVNQSDAVVGYFQGQLDLSNQKLNEAEQELLEFNQNNTIINYYEQTRHIAAEKELFDMRHLEIKLENAASESAIKVLENKLTSKEKQRINNETINSLRKELGQLNLDLALRKFEEQDDSIQEEKIKEMGELRIKAYNTEQQLKTEVLKQYNINYSPDGVHTESILQQWIDKVVSLESTNAQLKVADLQNIEFEKLYENYAPLGATMKRLERKINVAEQEYLSLLHSLGVAKLNQQSIELNSNLKTVTPPLFPIVAEPSKRNFLLIIAFIVGFIIPAFTIIVLEFMDQNIKTSRKAEKSIGLEVAAIFPNLYKFNKKLNVDFIKSRGLDVITRKLIFKHQKKVNLHSPSRILLFSTQDGEGKTFIANYLLEKLASVGYKVLFISDKNINSSSEVKSLNYAVDHTFYKYENISDFFPSGESLKTEDFDFIFVEIPGIINNTYPINLFKNADYSFLITRANRAWINADNYALSEILDVVDKDKIQVLLNGVEMLEMETVLGDLPKKRSKFRKAVKNIIRLQFFSKNKFSKKREV